ncbi:MAG TPA: SH3 domain-containing protein [Gemmatimonadaceae bacterium]|nr:SH3 domain-containing protein [Gemmatimonadaceae bacterium]
MRSCALLLTAALLSSGCASAGPATAAGRGARRSARGATDTVTIRDPELEKRLARVELRLMEKEAQVEDLQLRLDDARAEVVRTMAKLRTVASRAEAASTMAEVDVALQSLRSNGAANAPEFAQAAQLARQSAAEFDKQNFGGALYLANQAKSLTAAYRRRVGEGNRGATRAGEVPFALPIRLKTSGRGNVREGPGTSFDVTFAVESGTVLTGVSYADDWIRVNDEDGRSGWIFRALVTRP